MKKLFIAILCIPFLAFASQEKDQLYNSILVKHVSDQAKNGLEVVSAGCSSKEKISQFSVLFMTRRKMGIDEARRLFVKSSVMLLDLINNDKKIQPYLDEVPFTASGLDYTISFAEKNYKELRPPYVASVSVRKGVVYYYFNRLIGLGRDETLTKSEPYEEALRIVNEERKAKLS